MNHPTVVWPRVFRSIIASLLLAGLLAPAAWGQTPAPTPDDRARFLAAMPVSDGSPLKKLEQLPSYRAYVTGFSQKWQAAQKDRWDAMTAWAREEIWPRLDRKLTLFYMFGGPDYINAHVLYPDAPRYILCGLEPIGRIPAIETWTEPQLAAGLKALSSSLESMLEQGFFITSEMQKELTYGVLPILYLSLARAGNQITSVEYLNLNEQGQVLTVAGDDPVKSGARGVRIKFRRGASASEQELCYFRTNLDDVAIRADGRFLRYMNAQGTGNSLVKAASYRMHSTDATMIRDFLIAHSATLLQDDSGIAYRDLKPTRWRIQLYGNYSGPPSSIAWAVQPDLKAAYAVPGAVKPLSFKTSYRAKQYANLLFAVPTTAPRSQPAR